MANYLKILINSDITLSAGETLYVYIIGNVSGDYYSYNLSTDGNYVASYNTADTVYAIELTSLGVDASRSNTYYFQFDQSQAFSGRVWFSTANNLLTITNGAVSQPEPGSGAFFDFTEFTIVAGTCANCDTSQVVGLGIPITMVNPSELAFPPSGDTSQYTYPNAVGIVPGQSLNTICNNFTNYVNAIGLSDFSACVQNYSGTKWLMNPGSQIANYAAGTTPSGLATSLDGAIEQFFTYFYNSGNTLNITFGGMNYTGSTLIQAGIDTGNPTQEYCYLNLVDTNNIAYPIYYPYFNTNSALPQGGGLNPGGTLPPPPSFWTSGGSLPTTSPASAQALLCEGVFNDGNPTVSNSVVLAGLQNIVVSLINRGLIPGGSFNNFFPCDGTMSLNITPTTVTDPAPNESCSLSGASLLYTPTLVPAGLQSTAGAGITGSVNLEGALTGGKTLVQAVNGTSVAAAPSGASNYCTSPVIVQFMANPDGSNNQLLQFAFNYDSAVWPSSNTPALSSSVTITYENADTAMTGTFTGENFSSEIVAGMNVFDISTQNPGTITAASTTSLTVQSSINGLNRFTNPDTLIVGNFYPVSKGQAVGCWNAYAAFLHYGGNGSPAPYISNQGYAFAYDDDGGYSSDITVNFPASGDVSLGLYLGPLS